MLNIEKNHKLAKYTTLKAGDTAQYFTVVKTKDELIEAIAFSRFHKIPVVVLGGGSNILFSGKIKGLVIKNEIKGIEIVKETKTRAYLRAYSGESWSSFVSYAVSHKLYGLENLFLIYGTVGAAPVQNIGAYGVELKDVFYSLRAIDLKTGKEKVFKTDDCHFAYRSSIFKGLLKNKYFIYQVTVVLSKVAKLKLDYGSIKDNLEKKGIKKPGLKEVIKVISEIRNSKLPNPYVLSNAGSFFKNPEISKTVFEKIQKKYPEIPFFLSQKKIKIPAAWLIEHAGFKGKKFGPVRMYEKQALILVSEGGSAKQILKLVNLVKKGVKTKFGLDLKEEVNVI